MKIPNDLYLLPAGRRRLWPQVRLTINLPRLIGYSPEVLVNSDYITDAPKGFVQPNYSTKIFLVFFLLNRFSCWALQIKEKGSKQHKTLIHTFCHLFLLGKRYIYFYLVKKIKFERFIQLVSTLNREGESNPNK